MKILYLDCSSGIAGDMTLAALVDAGADREYVMAQLGRLGLSGWRLDFAETTRGGIRGLKAEVSIDEEKPRSYEGIKATIKESALDHPVRDFALHAFQRLAEAEAKVHGTEVGRTQFHEVGALDAIIDIVGTGAALHSLNCEQIMASPVAVGSGTTQSAHGTLPVPAPATLEILSRAKAPVAAGGEGELTTPTGAALLVEMVDGFSELPAITLHRTGHGAGSSEREVPNLLRVLVGTAGPPDTAQRIIIATNLDDMAPEFFPHVVQQLLDAGADDAWVTPIVMKKGRPAFTLSALTSRNNEGAVARVFFAETTTLGLRTSVVEKQALDRDWVLVEVSGAPVQVKIARFEGRITNVAPEYEDAVAISRSSGLPLREVYRAAVEAAVEQLRASS